MEWQPPSESGDIDDRDEAPGHEQPKRDRESRGAGGEHQDPRHFQRRKLSPRRAQGPDWRDAGAPHVAERQQTGEKRDAGHDQRERVQRRRDGECALEDVGRELLTSA